MLRDHGSDDDVKCHIIWALTVAMVAQGGRGDDGGATSEMDWMVVQWRLFASSAELGNGDGGARLALAGEGEVERGRESESE